MSHFDAGSPPRSFGARSPSAMSPPSVTHSPARKRPRKQGPPGEETGHRKRPSASRANSQRASTAARGTSVSSSRYNSVAPSGGEPPSAILASGVDNVSVFDFLHATGNLGGPSNANKRKRPSKFSRDDSERLTRVGTLQPGDDELAPHGRQAGPTGVEEGQQADQEFNLDWDAVFDEEQKEADRRYHEMLPHVAALRAKMEPDQLARYEMAFNDHTKTIQPQRINEFLQSKYGYEVSRDLGMVISILGKTHIGEMVERARAIQAAKGETGPLTPQNLRDAHQAYVAEAEKSERRTIGTRPKKKLFGGL